MTSAPRDRRVATFACVAACSHISVCIAGANTTGHRAVSSVLVSRSSASPWAALARMSAVAGATTTRSALCPIRTCGTTCTSVQTSVETGLPDSAAQVGAPTNSSAAAVGTTVTSCPDSVNRRSSSAALYAAMPPETPRTTRVPAGPVMGLDLLLAERRGGVGSGLHAGSLFSGQRLGVDLLHGQEVLVDLAQRDREGLLLDVGVDQRADVLQQALAELGVVGVDLAGALGAVEHQLVLAVTARQQLVDRRVGHV